MKTLLLNQSDARLPRLWMERWLRGLERELTRRRVAKAQFFAKRELVVVLVRAEEMRRLNRLYRELDKFTDILSFAPSDDSTMGELVLCMETIREQSERTGLGLRGETGYMLVHGVLHLLGYDHETKRERAEMFALQDELYGVLAARVGLR